MSGRIPLALTAMVLVIAPGTPWAQSVAEVLDQWKLFGTWSANCQLSPKQSPQVTYMRQPDAKVVLSVDFGDGRDSVGEVSAARPGPDGSLEVTLTQPKESLTIVLVRDKAGLVRSMSSRNAEGHYYIRDGKVVANGAPSPWLTRCR